MRQMPGVLLAGMGVSPQAFSKLSAFSTAVRGCRKSGIQRCMATLLVRLKNHGSGTGSVVPVHNFFSFSKNCIISGSSPLIEINFS